MLTPIDLDGPLTASQQMAETIRYRIAVGDLKAGDRLPSLRAAAEMTGSHYLTVRKAYQQLQGEDLVEIVHGQGARVAKGVAESCGGVAPAGPAALIEEFVARAWREHGIGPAQLAERVKRVVAHQTAREPGLRVVVVECNGPQAADYADQIKHALGISCTIQVLADDGEPPPGPIVSTYFHFSELRARLPHRIDDFHFVTVTPDPKVAGDVRRTGATAARVCELSRGRSDSVLPELERLLQASGIRVVPLIVGHPGESLRSNEDRSPILFAPRLWALLTTSQKSDPRSLKLRYVIQPSALDSLAGRLGMETKQTPDERCT